MRFRIIPALLAMALGWSPARADVVVLKSGARVDGVITMETDKCIVILPADAKDEVVIDRTDILRVEKKAADPQEKQRKSQSPPAGPAQLTTDTTGSAPRNNPVSEQITGSKYGFKLLGAPPGEWSPGFLGTRYLPDGTWLSAGNGNQLEMVNGEVVLFEAHLGGKTTTVTWKSDAKPGAIQRFSFGPYGNALATNSDGVVAGFVMGTVTVQAKAIGDVVAAAEVDEIVDCTYFKWSRSRGLKTYPCWAGMRRGRTDLLRRFEVLFAGRGGPPVVMWDAAVLNLYKGRLINTGVTEWALLGENDNPFRTLERLKGVADRPIVAVDNGKWLIFGRASDAEALAIRRAWGIPGARHPSILERWDSDYAYLERWIPLDPKDPCRFEQQRVKVPNDAFVWTEKWKGGTACGEESLANRSHVLGLNLTTATPERDTYPYVLQGNLVRRLESVPTEPTVVSFVSDTGWILGSASKDGKQRNVLWIGDSLRPISDVFPEEIAKRDNFRVLAEFKDGRVVIQFSDEDREFPGQYCLLTPNRIAKPAKP